MKECPWGCGRGQGSHVSPPRWHEATGGQVHILTTHLLLLPPLPAWGSPTALWKGARHPLFGPAGPGLRGQCLLPHVQSPRILLENQTKSLLEENEAIWPQRGGGGGLARRAVLDCSCHISQRTLPGPVQGLLGKISRVCSEWTLLSCHSFI